MQIDSSPQAKIFHALCLALSERSRQVDWAAFTPAEWDLLPRLAASHGVAPMLHWIFRQQGYPEAFPPPARRALAGEFYKTSAYNQLLYRELARLLGAFARAAIPVIVLKGAALAVTVYPDLACRPMNDLDLLLPPENLPGALRLARACGFQLEKITFHAVLRGGPQLEIPLELHWDLANAGIPSAALDSFWARAQPFRLPQAAGGLALDPAANLVYLAGHLEMHSCKLGERLGWSYDLHRLLVHSASGLDWAGALDLAQRCSLGAALSKTLADIRHCFSTPMPAGFNQAPIIESQSTFDPNREAIAWVRASLRRLGWRTQLSVVLGLLFPSPAYLRWRYRPRPAWLWPLCYLVRWGSFFSF